MTTIPNNNSTQRYIAQPDDSQSQAIQQKAKSIVNHPAFEVAQQTSQQPVVPLNPILICDSSSLTPCATRELIIEPENSPDPPFKVREQVRRILSANKPDYAQLIPNPIPLLELAAGPPNNSRWVTLTLDTDPCCSGNPAPTPGHKQAEPGALNSEACPQIQVISPIPESRVWRFGSPLTMPVHAVSDNIKGIDFVRFLFEFAIPKQDKHRRLYTVGLPRYCYGEQFFNVLINVYPAVEWKGHFAAKFTFKTLDQSHKERWKNPTVKSTTKLVKNSGELNYEAGLNIRYGNQEQALKIGYDLAHNANQSELGKQIFEQTQKYLDWLRINVLELLLGDQFRAEVSFAHLRLGGEMNLVEHRWRVEHAGYIYLGFDPLLKISVTGDLLDLLLGKIKKAEKIIDRLKQIREWRDNIKLINGQFKPGIPVTFSGAITPMFRVDFNPGENPKVAFENGGKLCLEVEVKLDFTVEFDLKIIEVQGAVNVSGGLTTNAEVKVRARVENQEVFVGMQATFGGLQFMWSYEVSATVTVNNWMSWFGTSTISQTYEESGGVDLISSYVYPNKDDFYEVNLISNIEALL